MVQNWVSKRSAMIILFTVFGANFKQDFEKGENIWSLLVGIEIWFKVTTHPLPILLGKRVNHFGQRGEVIPDMPQTSDVWSLEGVSRGWLKFISRKSIIQSTNWKHINWEREFLSWLQLHILIIYIILMDDILLMRFHHLTVQRQQN